MVTYYQRQKRRLGAHWDAAERRQEKRRERDQWLERAATADQIIGYTAIAVIACSVVLLIVEAAPKILPAVAAWVTQ